MNYWPAPSSHCRLAMDTAGDRNVATVDNQVARAVTREGRRGVGGAHGSGAPRRCGPEPDVASGPKGT